MMKHNHVFTVSVLSLSLAACVSSGGNSSEKPNINMKSNSTVTKPNTQQSATSTDLKPSNQSGKNTANATSQPTKNADKNTASNTTTASTKNPTNNSAQNTANNTTNVPANNPIKNVDKNTASNTTTTPTKNPVNNSAQNTASNTTNVPANNPTKNVDKNTASNTTTTPTKNPTNNSAQNTTNNATNTPTNNPSTAAPTNHSGQNTADTSNSKTPAQAIDANYVATMERMNATRNDFIQNPPETSSLKDVQPEKREDVMKSKENVYLMSLNEFASDFDFNKNTVEKMNVYVNGKPVEVHVLKQVPKGFSSTNIQYDDGKGNSYKETVLAYDQPYSLVFGSSKSEISKNGEVQKNDFTLSFDDIRGLKTDYRDMENLTGTATYTGGAFTEKEHNGHLIYHVNFGDRTGWGKISNLKEMGDVELHKVNYGDSSQALGTAQIAKDGEKHDAYYRVGFFGTKAEEVAGVVYENGNHQEGVIGFGGSKQ